MKTLRRKKKKSGMEGCGPRGLVGMLLRMFCCLELVACKYIPWVLGSLVPCLHEPR